MPSIRHQRQTSWVLAAVAATTAVALTSCGQLPIPQAQQPQPAPSTVTVTQSAPQNSQETKENQKSTSSKGTPKSSSREPEAEDGIACHTSELRARFYPDKMTDLEYEPNGPGTSHTVLRLANVSGRTCTVRGYARIEFVDKNGATVQPNYVENPAGPSASTISLATRQGAAQDLFWNYQKAGCADPDQVRIYPPNNTDPITLPWNLGVVCDGVGMQHGRLFPN